MPKRVFDVRAGQPMLFDIASYARRGPGRRERFSAAEIELIARTVQRTPEVMVKVLSRGGQDLGAVGQHIGYLSRGGTLELETDEGERIAGRDVEKALLEDWDLDLETDRRSAALAPRACATSPKLVHKLLFSMPPGTAPENVLAAVRDFAREEFALRHRYAMVLHTDEPHPHVHVVVKAVREEGVRLHIRKAGLRAWRQEFARHLRAHGIAANATERAARGESRSPKPDGISRAERRGKSTHVRDRTAAIARGLLTGDLPAEPGQARLLATRQSVERGWWAIHDSLMAQAQPALAAQAARFVAGMRPARTEREWVAEELRRRDREDRTQDRGPAR